MCDKNPSFKLLQTLHKNRSGLNCLLTADRNSHQDIIHKHQLTTKMATNDKTIELSEDEDVCDHTECRRTVFVRSVPHSIRRKELNEFFSEFGSLSKVSIHSNCRTRKSKGTAHVQFVRLEDALNVLELPDHRLMCRNNVLKAIPNRCQRVWKYKSAKRMTVEENPVAEIEINDSEDTDCYINMLPMELLRHIFSFLDFKERILSEKVCKLWRHLGWTIPWANVYSLILEDTHFPHRQRLNSSVLEAILTRCGSTLKKLDLSMSLVHSLSHKFPIVIGNHCPNLEEINLSRKDISCKALGVLVESCPKLKNIDLSKSCAGDKWISKILRHCQVVELNLSYNNKISGKNFHLMKDSIRMLNLNFCINLLPDVLGPISKISSIRELHLNGCSSLSLNSVENMFKLCGPVLRILDLGGYFPNLTRSVFVEGLAKSVNIEELLLENNNYINDDVCQVLSANCARLHTLNLSSCFVSDVGLKRLRRLDCLHNLFVNYNERITSKSLEELSVKGLLEHIELRGCSSIGDSGCSALIVNCRKLKLLDISSCTEVTDCALAGIELVNRSEDVKLIVYCGGSSVSIFNVYPSVEVQSVNKCPREHRPWTMDLYYEEDSDDDDWNDAFYGDYDGDYDSEFGYDYDSDYLFDENDDVDAWEMAYMNYGLQKYSDGPFFQVGKMEIFEDCSSSY
uniref:RRM domain-containing protein n=1 Tax=Strigamia maritima TaxID=126957 RepID=T1JBW5_STRMM